MQAISLKNQAILLKYEVFERENEFEKIFMEEGPQALCEKLGIYSTEDPEWQAIFEYFVLNKNILAGLVKRYIHHFKELYEENGPTKVREILWIHSPRYDVIWRPLHDLIGVAEGSLLNYVYNNRFSLNRRFQVYGAERLREYLELEGNSYDGTWEKALDIMLQTTTAGYFSERTVDDALKFFSVNYSDRRMHKNVRKLEKARV